MDIRNCRSCGSIFNYVSGPIICPSCREGLEAKFQEVKDYIKEHPGVTIPQVSEACDVDAQQIRQWLRDERLETTEDSAVYLDCEVCGAAIRSGRFCEKCKANMVSDLKGVMQRPKAAPQPRQNTRSDSAKMRFLS